MDFKNELAALRPDLGEGVGALFTEREGGVSSGPWGGVDGIMGLNVSTRVGDNGGCVRMNRSIVEQLTPGEIHWMTQVHGADVVAAEDVKDEAHQADAQFTTVSGVVCAVQVADCLPVLIAEKNARAVAAVHAGWRSLAAGVVENTVEAMRRALNDPAAQFKAWLGPRIGFEDFETGAEVKEIFEKNYPEVENGFKAAQDKYLVNLAAYAEGALAKVAVTEVEDCALSTVADAKRFYSYRRDGEKTGRHSALIWIEK